MSLSLSPQSLARGSARHPWRVVAIWAVVIVASFLLIGRLMSTATTTEAKVTSSPDSVRAQRLLEDRLRGPFKANEAVIIESSSSTVDDAAFRSYVQNLHSQIKDLKLKEDGPPVVESSTTFYESNAPTLVSADRKATIIPLVMTGSIDEAADGIKKVLQVVEDENHKGQFEVHVAGFASIGHDFNEQAEKDLQRSEYGPLPLALIILIIVFGALVAAFLPVILAFFSIFIAVALTAVIGQQWSFSFFVVNMILMMGLAVGIDYCLFIISRFREERAQGVEKIEAITIAGSTAGRTVVFSGITVVLALAGLLIVPQTIFRSLSAGAIFVVLAAVAAAVTLLPAVLSLLGDKIEAPRLGFLRRTRARLEVSERRAGGFWDRVAHTVMAHPVISVVLVTSALIAMTIPYFSIEIGFSGVTTLPESFQSRQGFERIAEKFQGGQVYPAEIVIDGDANSSAVKSANDRLLALTKSDSVFGPGSYEVNKEGNLGLLSIQMSTDPNSHDATNAIERLREQYIPQAYQGVDASVFVGGLAAQNLDFFNLTDDYTPIVFAFVLGLSFLLLMMVFRSIVVPAKAIVMNLLSVGAAYGLIVLVFQQGVGNEIFGFQQVEAIEAWLPLFLFSILFGLSMDYHVFLISRIKEHYDLTGDNTAAVAHGLRSTGRLITGAALIMVAVFGGFAMGELVMFQQMGFGLAFAVLIDATIIRSILVPASMKLLGRWNWYLPPVLSWLPHLSPEAPAPVRQRYAQEGAGGGS